VASGWGAVTASQKTAADANSRHQIAVDCRKLKQYVRYNGTIAGTTPSFLVGVDAIKGAADNLPAA
jgi:hypothetical protein